MHLTGDDLILLAQGLLFLACLPVAVPFVVRLWRDLRAGPQGFLPDDNAWPDACWGCPAGSYEFVLAALLVHIVMSMLIVGPGLYVFDVAALRQSQPVRASAISGGLMIVAWLATFALLLWYIIKGCGASADVFGLRLARPVRTLGRALLALLGTMPAVLALLYATHALYMGLIREPPPVHGFINAIARAEHPALLAVLVAMSGLIVPVLEELFYRGIIMTTLLRTGRPAVAIVGSGLLFGLVHLTAQVTSVPALAAFGIALGYVYYRTRNLWAPVAMHAAFNLYSLGLTIVAPRVAAWLSNLSQAT